MKSSPDGPTVMRLVAGRSCSDHEGEETDDERDRRPHAGAAAAVGNRGETECCKLHESAGEVVESGRTGLGLQE